jgi:thioredoxin 1
MADLVLTDQNFEAEVLRSDIPVLVDFWAEWCHPCRIVGPIVEELAEDYKGKLKVGKVNVDQNQAPGNYGIMSIPSLLIFKNGKVVKTMVGAQSKENYKREIDSVLD